MNILVVDDHPLYRSGVVYTLQNTGLDVNVIECSSLDTAFQRMDAGLQPDLMVLDLQMPGYQGLDSVRAVRNRRPEVPVLVLAGSDDPAVVRECIDLGLGKHEFTASRRNLESELFQLRLDRRVAARELAAFHRSPVGMLVADGRANDRLRVVELAISPDEIGTRRAEAVLLQEADSPHPVELIERSPHRLARSQL